MHYLKKIVTGKSVHEIKALVKQTKWLCDSKKGVWVNNYYNLTYFKPAKNA